eukprot:6240340-Alexandrium_andersonii.AAC.1
MPAADAARPGQACLPSTRSLPRSLGQRRRRSTHLCGWSFLTWPASARTATSRCGMQIGRTRSFCPCRGPRSHVPSAPWRTRGRPTRSAS